jgi:hypothetical protein
MQEIMQTIEEKTPHVLQSEVAATRNSTETVQGFLEIG